MTTNSLHICKFNSDDDSKRGLLYAKDGVLHFDGNAEASAATHYEMINAHALVQCVEQGENFALLVSDNEECKFRIGYDLAYGVTFEGQAAASFWDYAECLAAELSKIKLGD